MLWVGTIFVALWFAGSREPAPHELPMAITGCSAELAESLPALVSLEIDILMRERGATRSRPQTIAVRCAYAGDIVVIEVALPQARRESSVALGGMAPRHRARVLALAVAELVDALTTAAAPAAAPAQQPVAATVQAERAAPPAPRPATARSPSGLLGGTVDWLGKPAALLLGARLSYLHPLGAFLTPMLSLDGNLGDAASSAGRVAARTVAGGVHVLLRAPVGPLRVEAGPGFRFGWAHLAGQPGAGSMLDGHALSAWWGGPEVRVRTTTTWPRGPGVALELGAGLVVLPVRGLVDGGAAAYTLDGLWLSLALQLGLDLKR